MENDILYFKHIANHIMNHPRHTLTVGSQNCSRTYEYTVGPVSYSCWEDGTSGDASYALTVEDTTVKLYSIAGRELIRAGDARDKMERVAAALDAC